MLHKYGEFTSEQIELTKVKLRKSIFFLLLCVDPKTSEEYKNVDVHRAFYNLLYLVGGLNEALYSPPELVTVIALLEAALMEYQSVNFDYQVYRKLILDAGAEILKIKEGKADD